MGESAKSVFCFDDNFNTLHIKCRCTDSNALRRLENLALEGNDVVAKGYYAVTLYSDEFIRMKVIETVNSLAQEILDALCELASSEEADANIHFLLGYFNYHGLGCLEDISKAASHFMKASEQNHILALCSLGSCFYKGWLDHPPDLDKAFRQYKLSADMGNPVAQYNVGLCLELGMGIDIDIVCAMEYYRSAADKGYPDAQYSMGVCLETASAAGSAGRTEADMLEAFKYYSLAAEKGHPIAQHAVGVCLECGDGVEKNAEQAAAAFLLAAEEGYPPSQFCAGQSYEYGKGVQKDLGKAVKFYLQAADGDSAEGQFMAGWSLEFGQGVSVDIPRAVDYYQRAADNGHTLAQVNVARCYEQGVGVEADNEKARAYYSAAAQENGSCDPITASLAKRAANQLQKLMKTE